MVAHNRPRVYSRASIAAPSPSRGGAIGQRELNTALILATSLILLSLSAPLTFAVPPVATEFYGTVTNDGSGMSGTITVNASDGTFCGMFTTSTAGKYGLLSCRGNDPDTAAKEGADGSEQVRFTIDGEPLRAYGNILWGFGEFHEVNLSTFAVCGDAYCDALQNETCSSCQIDCGPCNLTNSTTNNTGNGTGGNGTSGGGGSTGGGGSSGGGGELTGGGGSSGGGAAGLPPECKERWECGIWRPRACPPTEVQTRQCRDLNNCGTTETKPPTEQTCRYAGTCQDGLKNNNETDIDCGGDLCPRCEIGKRCIDNDDCRSDYCEENVCLIKPPTKPPVIGKARPPEIAIPGLVLACGDRIPWEVLIPLLLLSITPKILAELYLRKWVPKHHKRYRTWPQEDKFKYQIKVRSRAFWACVGLFIVALFVSFYAYLFFGCPDFIGLGLFIMIILALWTFAGLYGIARYLEYHEDKTHEKLKRMLSAHQSTVQKLLRIESRALTELEEELVKMLGEFADGKDPALADAQGKLKPLTLALTTVLEIRAKGADPAAQEAALIAAGKPLVDDNLLKSLAERLEPLQRILTRLQLLVNHYEAKQKVLEDN